MVKVSAEIIEQIKKHGEETYPEECCGVLIGKFSQDEKEIFEFLRIENSSESEKNRRFLITPENYLMAERYSREKNLDIVGFYHSHPDHPAKPSDYDREHALPFFSYFIVSVENGIAKEINSWVLKEDRSGFEFEEIEIKNKI
ncbi:Proteasome lid subunit RPN8/RPN11, contains Jab1/MPN metalloenzyme (JAMM) motif [Candidatus Thermokryptus mobilis]|uniref:Proteasome lid subunit RPN8/RPN11, contains Jab1/MPN metalloenzyme (JAMM) motif n=1 Tax=Candidatus Thermokryptus mobilis TaxID=1643428 RepID=A0A0S4MVQ0_9BACT|nr:M67 family metallopeptidase [Candidatus Thermokryptus mobilis]CUU02821.1 Proteasome lid subunit RPN8/RPN11, contains Jab1/MPN metalloenzyme (JAMM) motif [Candidatus Thermokryptus mobilis]